MKLLNNLKPHKKIYTYFITRQGTLLKKKKTADVGKIEHEGGTYTYTREDVLFFKKTPYVFFFEDNPHALNLKHKNAPVMDAESFQVALKMEAIKATQEIDAEQKKQMILIVVFVLIAAVASTVSALAQFEII